MRRNELWSLLQAIFLYFLLLVPLLSLYDDIGTNATVIYLESVSVISLFFYWRITHWGRAKYTSFGGALILFAILFRLMAISDVLFNGVNELKWPPTLPIYGDFEWLFIKGEGITQVGYLLSVASWRIAVTGSLNYLYLKKIITFEKNYKSKLLYLFFTAIVVTALFRLTSIDLGGFAQLTAGFIFIGIAAIYLYAYDHRSRWNRVGISFALALPIGFISMKSGMKEAIFLPFVPCFLLMWHDFKALPARTFMVAGALLVFSIGQIYASYVRENLWNSNQEESSLKIAAAVFENINQDSFSEALESAFQRVNYAIPHAITMAVVDRNGFYFDEVYSPLPATFIPRMIWPDKPAFQPGSAHSRRILGSSRDIAEMTSATAPGLYAEMYLGGGYIIMMVSAIVYGFLIGNLQIWVLKNWQPLATSLFNYRLLYQAIRFDENTVLYAYNGIVLFMCTLWLAMRLLYSASDRGKLAPLSRTW